MPCPILYILTARINITGSNKGMKKKTGRQRYTDRKLVVWALSWRSLSTPTQHGFEQRGRILHTAEQEIKVITYR